MKASVRQQGLLLELQDLDTSILRLQRDLARLPEILELKDLELREPELKAQFLEKQKVVEDMQTELSRIESDTELVRARKVRSQERLAASTVAKEATALQEELNALQLREERLDDQQLILMERLEDAEAELSNALQELAAFDGDRQTLIQSRTAKEAELEKERAVLENERQGLIAEIDRPLFEVYDSVQKRYGLGAAKLIGKVSGGSNMELDAADFKRALDTPSDELFFCPVSGIILVRESAD